MEPICQGAETIPAKWKLLHPNDHSNNEMLTRRRSVGGRAEQSGAEHGER